MIKWNKNVKLILSDVDETIADIYIDSAPQMIIELTRLLKTGIILFLVSGGGLDSILKRVILKFENSLRKNILVAHCSGAEVYGFDNAGKLKKPYLSEYDRKMNASQKKNWRILTQKLISAFNLKTYPAMNLKEFRQVTNNDPLSVMYVDRGPQITLELPNSYDLNTKQLKQIPFTVQKFHQKYDLRINLETMFNELNRKYQVPIEIAFGGEFALDMKLKGVSKLHAIKSILTDQQVLMNYGLDRSISKAPDLIEIWGDKFSEVRKGTDRFMSYAVNPKVRSISFRDEVKQEFKAGYNIMLWDGAKRLHEGLLEYLQNSEF